MQAQQVGVNSQNYSSGSAVVSQVILKMNELPPLSSVGKFYYAWNLCILFFLKT